tara:strand:+ start:823 stop:1206 length:384 start_codon:yes stop_codon:yes gene_type:complete
MDKTTTWLIRGAALVIIVFGSIVLTDYLQVKRAINSTKTEYVKQQEAIEKCESIRTLRYSDFIEAVQEKQVSRVLISPDNGKAQIVERDGNTALVNLAPDQGLLKLLTDNEVDIAVTSSSDFISICP